MFSCLDVGVLVICSCWCVMYIPCYVCTSVECRMRWLNVWDNCEYVCGVVVVGL